jgi:hypothetical protein
MALVVCLAIILMAGGVTTYITVVNDQLSNSALQTVVGVMQYARETAIDQRVPVEVTFSASTTVANTVNVYVGSYSGGVVSYPSTPTLSSSISHDGTADVQFVVVSGVPTTAPPDGFGSAQYALDFDQGNGGAGTSLFFVPDGRALDAVNRVNSGVLYLAIPNKLFSSRAITVWGATGRIKGWRLAQSGSTYYWDFS